MQYPENVVGWLTDICSATEWKLSPLEVLRTETEYPGLIDDMMTELWQRQLVKEQTNGN